MRELTGKHVSRRHLCAARGNGDVSARFFREEEKGLVGLFVDFRNPNRAADGAAEIVVSLNRWRIG